MFDCYQRLERAPLVDLQKRCCFGEELPAVDREVEDFVGSACSAARLGGAHEYRIVGQNGNCVQDGISSELLHDHVRARRHFGGDDKEVRNFMPGQIEHGFQGAELPRVRIHTCERVVDRGRFLIATEYEDLFHLICTTKLAHLLLN